MAEFMALPREPAKGLVVLTCMDARIDPLAALGLERGDAHIIRNAGALASEDALRSANVSRTVMGTTQACVVGHSDCAGFQSDGEARESARAAAKALEELGFETRALFFDVRTGDVSPVD